jgi:dUTP pyrophosphatase
MKTVKVKRLKDTATLPTRAHEFDAGMDLYASEDVEYRPGNLILVPTAIAVEIPSGYVGLVRDRSSVSKTKLKVTAGVVDAGYTGEVCVVLLNHSGEYGCIRKGSKIAQLLIIPVATPSIVEVSELSDSERGDKGFGSSGV